jgi:hypothetical protein
MLCKFCHNFKNLEKNKARRTHGSLGEVTAFRDRVGEGTR